MLRHKWNYLWNGIIYFKSDSFITFIQYGLGLSMKEDACHVLQAVRVYHPLAIDSQPHTQSISPILTRTTAACGIPSPPTIPRVGLKTSSTSSLERRRKISHLILRKIICALSKSKRVGKLFARRMYLAAIAKGFDGWLCTLDSFMAAQWKLLIMNDNISISLTLLV